MSSSTELYNTIKSTASSFLDAQNPEPGTNKISAKPSPCTSSCLTSFGPSFLISSKPMLQGTKNNDEFLAHMKMMTPMLETWRAEVTRILVDEHHREASLWAMYYMVPKGEGSSESRTVQHEIIWWLKMTEDGKLVQTATEYVDGSAAARIQELIGEYKRTQGDA